MKMTLQKAIEIEKSIAKNNYELADSYHTDFNVYMKQEDTCRERAEYHEQVAEWLEELQRLKEKEPCEDYVFKKLWEQVKGERDVAIEQLKQLGYYLGEKGETSEDCISRQAVLDIIDFEDKWLLDAKSHNKNTTISFNALKSYVKDLPSVTPKSESDEPVDILDKYGK